MVSDSLNQLAAGLRQDASREQSQRQFDATQTLSREQLAALNAREAAQLAEQQTYHQGSLGVQNRNLDLEEQQKRAQAVKAYTDAVLSGNHIAAKSMQPYLASQNIQLEQLPMEVPKPAGMGIPGMPPSDMSFSFEEANPGEARPMSNKYRLSHAGQTLGDLDLDQISHEQLAQVQPMLDALVNGSHTEDRDARTMATDAVSSVPQLAADPEKALEAVNKIAQPQIGQEHADRRADAMSQTRRTTGGEGLGLRVDALTKQAYDSTLNRIKKDMDSKQIQQRMMDSSRSDELIREAGGGEATTNPNALAGRVAMQNLIRSTIRGVSSDRDLKAYMDAGGKEAQVENWLNQWTAGGALSSSQLRMMSEIARHGKRVAKQEQIDMARQARDAVKGIPLFIKYPELRDAYADQAEREILGQGPAPQESDETPATGWGGRSSSTTTSLRGPAAAKAMEDMAVDDGELESLGM